MDQQDNPAVPGASARKGQPAPVWGGAPDDHASDAPDYATYEPIPQQPAQGWGGPVPGSPSAGWGTTPAAGQEPRPGTGWGAPQPYAPDASPRTVKGSWTAKKGLLVGGVAVVVAAAAGAGAYAAGNGSTAASANNGLGSAANGQFGPGGQSSMNGQGGMAGPGSQTGTDGGATGRDMDGGLGLDGGPGGLGMGGAGLNAALHSEYVVLRDSSYVTMAGQTGTVTEVSGTSLTVKSEDGFSRTYAVGSDVQVTQGMRQRGGSAGSTLSLSNVTAGATVRITALKNSDTYTAQTIQLAAAGTETPSSGTSSN